MESARRTVRDAHRGDSNNPENPNKHICALRVAQALGVDREVRYLHTVGDIVRAARRGRYLVRSRRSAVRGSTVGAVRSQLQEKVGATYYIVRVEGHALLLGQDGRTLVDTDPRTRDRRKITHLYGVWK